MNVVLSRGSELILVCLCIRVRVSILGNSDIVRVTPLPLPTEKFKGLPLYQGLCVHLG